MKKHLAARIGARIARSARGQSLIEFAALAPLAVVLLLAVADFGRVFYFAIALNNAARAGTQYGIQSPANAADVAGMQQAALNDAPNLSGLTAAASEYCQCPDGSSQVCNSSTHCSDMRVYVEVDTTGTFHTLLNYPGIPSSVAFSGKSVIREQ